MSTVETEISNDGEMSEEMEPRDPGAAVPPQPKGAVVVKKKSRRGVLLTIAAIVGAVALVGGIIWYLDARQYEKTDDAFIDGHIVELSPRVTGHVLKVLVEDNAEVKEGEPLVELDQADFETKVRQAQGNLEAAQAQQNQAGESLKLIQKTAAASKTQGAAGLTVAKAGIATAEAAIAQAQAQVVADEATAKKAGQDLERYQNLLKTGDVPQQQVDTATADSATANAKLKASRKAVVSAQAQLQEAQARVVQAEGQLAEVDVVPERTGVSQKEFETAGAQLKQLQAALDQAKLNLSYCTVKAPIAGRVTRRSVQIGSYVAEGDAMMAIVPEHLYVTANFKETQLQNMKVGQEVFIKVDAYPDQELKGKVDSFQQGSGSRFSVLPPENATGNYVKVVQRVPVKIEFDEPLQGGRDYSPGMSVEPKVKVR